MATFIFTLIHLNQIKAGPSVCHQVHSTKIIADILIILNTTKPIL